MPACVSWFWYARPYYFAILLTALLLAKRLKRHDFLSLPDVVAQRYGRPTQALVAIASFIYSLPLISIIVEPAKVLFVNNAINHGVFTPLGI